MVEEKGLDIVGIYRVPDNSQRPITEQVSVLASWKSINLTFSNICQVIWFYFAVKKYVQIPKGFGSLT